MTHTDWAYLEPARESCFGIGYNFHKFIIYPRLTMTDSHNQTGNGKSHSYGEQGGMYDKVNKSMDGFRKIVRENPAMVLGVAFGVGLLVGLLTSGKKSDGNQKQS